MPLHFSQDNRFAFHSCLPYLRQAGVGHGQTGMCIFTAFCFLDRAKIPACGRQGGVAVKVEDVFIKLWT